MDEKGRLILYDEMNQVEKVLEVEDKPIEPGYDDDTQKFIGNRHERRKQAALARRANKKWVDNI